LQLDLSALLPFLLRSHFCSAVRKIEYKLQDMKLKRTELGLCWNAAEAKIIKVYRGGGLSGGRFGLVSSEANLMPTGSYLETYYKGKRSLEEG
jgi:hypothetical protein